MGSLIFVMVLFFVILPLLRNAAKGNKKGGQQAKNGYLGRLTPEQRAQIEALRDKAKAGFTPNVTRAGDLFFNPQKEKPLDAEDPYAEKFYDEEWTGSETASQMNAPVSHDHVSPDCVYGPVDEVVYDVQGHPDAFYDDPTCGSGAEWDFDSASRGSRIKANDKWKYKPPVIAPLRPVPPSLFQEKRGEASKPKESAQTAAPHSRFSPGDMRRAVVMSEVLKRPKYGVAPRYR